MSINLNDGVRVTVRQPEPPRATLSTPSQGRAVVVPVGGPPGPQGPTGGVTYSHHQIAAAAAWTVAHHLGIKAEPLVLLDSAPETPVWTDVDITDADTLILTFPSPVSGWAHIN